MRLFLAFDIDDRARATIADTSAQFARRLGKLGAGGAVKWVERQNLHVTLRFLGEVTDADATRLISALEPPLAVAPFEMVLGGGGCFPAGGTPRVVWVGVTDGAEEARRIYAELDARVSVFDVEREERAYMPHLTLGRVREIQRTAGASLRAWTSELASPLAHVHVAAATLFRSLLSPKGPAYEKLHQVPLAPRPGGHA